MIGNDFIDEKIGAYLKANETNPGTIRELAVFFKSHPERIKAAARAVFRIYDEAGILVNEAGKWARARDLKQIYNLGSQYRCKIERAAKEKGGIVRKIKLRTYEKPISGEWFYNLNDIERYAPRLARLRKIIEVRNSLTRNEGSIKPKLLTEYEYETYRCLVLMHLEGYRYISAKMIAQKLGLCDSVTESIRLRLHSLRRKDYIDFRIPQDPIRDLGGNLIHGGTKPCEYRFHKKGPKCLIDKLKKCDPKLTEPFGKGNH